MFLDVLSVEFSLLLILLRAPPAKYLWQRHESFQQRAMEFTPDSPFFMAFSASLEKALGFVKL